VYLLDLNGIGEESQKMSTKRSGHKSKTAQNPIPSDRKELKVTSQQLVDYLNQINESAKCSFCGVGEYGVPSDPTGNVASIVATPTPHLQGMGVWLYTAVCGNCSHVIFFHAPGISKKIIKD
jgi:hypothetical protein